MRMLRPISAGLLLTTLVSGILPALSQPAVAAATITTPPSATNSHNILVDSDDYQALNQSVNVAETDPCPTPMAAVTLPELPTSTSGPQNPNFDIANQELPRTSHPLNCEFSRDRQVLLTSITPQSFTIQNVNQSQTTDSFVVDSSAQYLSFEYMVGRKTGDRGTPLGVEVLSGSNFATVTNVGVVGGQYLDGWKQGKLPIMGFRGQTIKLRFINDWLGGDEPSAQVRKIKLTVEIPDWELSPFGVSAIEYDDLIGAHAVITGVNTFIVSAPFTIPMQTQSLSFNYKTGRPLNNGGAPIGIQVLSGPNFETTTNLDSWKVEGRLSEGWKHATVGIQAFRGQVIKLKVSNDWWPIQPQTTYIDSFKLNRAVPGWEVSNTNYVKIDTLQLPLNDASNVLTNTDFELGFTPIADVIPNNAFDLPSTLIQTLSEPAITLTGPNATTTTASFVVPEHTTGFQFEALIGDSGNATLAKPVGVAILSGDTFDIREWPTDSQVWGSTQAGSQIGLIDIKRYQGKTIKVQFFNHDWDNPTSQLSNFRLVDHVPQWTASSQPRMQMINESSAHPSHVYLSKTRSTLVSAPFSLPSQAQQVRFDFQMGDVNDTNANRAAELTLLSGPDFSIRTRIDQGRLWGNTNNGWKTLALDLQDLRGQTVKLEFRLPEFDQPYLRVDNIEVGTATAGWWGKSYENVTIESTTTALGQSLRMDGALNSITSDPLTVLSTTVSLSFDYKSMHTDGTGNSFVSVNVFSGENFEVSTPIDAGTVFGTQNDPNGGWKQATLNLAQFQGRTIKLQFKHQQFGNSVSWFDNLSLNQGAASASHGPDEAPDGNLLELRNANNAAISTSFNVPTDTQWLRMEYQLSNLDNGNAQEALLVEVLSGNNFSTATFISQGITSRANDGWQVAKLPLSQFQGQTIKIRLLTHQFGTRSVVRVDKLALLSPRSTLTTPIVVTGTTYLNVPLTELGGITTTATMTITSLVVYDEYVDLAGQVRYANTTLPFALTGDLYNSSLGTPGDIVAELQDTTRTFDSLYFAVRQEPLGPQTNPTITNENLSLYIQRNGTREATVIDLGLDNTLNALLSPVFELASLEDADYGSDYWFGKLIEGDDSTVEAMGDPNENVWKWTRRIVHKDCTLLQQLKFGVVVEAPEVDILGGSGDFATQIEVLESITDGYVTPGQNWPADSCDMYDEDSAGVTLGSRDDPVSVKFASSGNNLKGNAAEGDYLSYITFGGKAAIYKNDKLWFDIFIAQMIKVIDVALAFYSVPINISSLLELIKVETPFIDDVPSLTNEMILADWDNNPDTKIKTVRVPFQQAILVNKNNRFTTKVTVACKKQNVSRDMQLKIYWDIPMYDNLTKREINNMLYIKNFIMNYKSGPCNK
ncbi:hypothetical protein [Herpetosiphon giganteus]|uniref:hypothetical protein n=1 Tax=Herpetosiphon giganteus TaxID=2029754 RepID=UPI00195BEB4C|nr:hypothetical protein [Herpetosiphon giganteus]MBM7842091.1 hypothetical protein [Herpetosiphon giganteus]